MELFDPKHVHFMWSAELEGKEGFVADDICVLTDCVSSGNLHCIKVSKSLNPAKPFKDVDNNEWLFFYYDPLYECKIAYYKTHKQIQFMSLSTEHYGEWLDCSGEPMWDEGYEYRVKPDEAKQSKRMTYRQLTEWLAKGNGEYRPNRTSGMAYIASAYRYNCALAIIPEDYEVRRWGSDEWIKPMVDVYKEDCE